MDDLEATTESLFGFRLSAAVFHNSICSQYLNVAWGSNISKSREESQGETGHSGEKNLGAKEWQSRSTGVMLFI